MDESTEPSPRSRRRLLTEMGGLATASLCAGLLQIRSDRAYTDSDGDGIPDELKRSATFDRFLRDTFGEQFEGLQRGRAELILDVRYVGDVQVHEITKQFLVQEFRANGITLHWLDYPTRYDLEGFNRRYGNNTRRILWARESFYEEVIEDPLKNVALQLVIVPGAPSGRYEGMIYSPWADLSGSRGDGYINGMSLGNRAVAGERHDAWQETRLIFHEVAHLGLCHSSAEGNTGVMGTNEELKLTSTEWERLRDSLHNVRDTTGHDRFLRRCLWLEDPGGLG